MPQTLKPKYPQLRVKLGQNVCVRDGEVKYKHLTLLTCKNRAFYI
jgi:hypothetical protein